MERSEAGAERMNGRSAHERGRFGELSRFCQAVDQICRPRSLPSVALLPQSTPDIMRRTLDSRD